MSAGNGGHADEFRRAMEALASDPEGWSGAAGDEFVSMMHRVLARMTAGRGRNGCDGGSSVVPGDAVAEAVLVVSGAGQLSMTENVHRILAMERPLGYVIGAVARNFARAELAGEMGTDSRQVSPGAPRVLHLYELESSMESDPLGSALCTARMGPWARRRVARGPRDSRFFRGDPLPTVQGASGYLEACSRDRGDVDR